MGRSSSWSTVGMESLLDEDALTMASSIEDLVNKLPAYDYIRCTFTDMNGVARGRVLPTSTTAEFLTKGMGLYAGENHLKQSYNVGPNTTAAKFGIMKHVFGLALNTLTCK